MKRTLSFILTIALLIPLSVIFSVAPAAETETIGNLDWFVVGMTVAESKTLVPAVNSIKRKDETLLNNAPVATGDVVTTDNGSYTAIVRGDVNSEGDATGVGYMLLKRHVLGTYELTGISLTAADINGDGNVSTVDYVLLKRTVLGTFDIQKPENAKQVPVLLYHHIVEDQMREEYLKDNNITIATSEFRRHMQMLKDNGKTVVTISDVVAYVRGEKLLKPGSIVLCFDDGYKSNTYFAAPILREFGNKATVFSIMCYYDGNYESYFDPSSLQHITREDLKNNTDVIDQQCHTWANHNHLPQQSYAEVYNDLMLSQNCEKYDYFAYPYGDYSASVKNAVIAAGFKAAFTTVTRSAVPGDDVYLIPRYTVTSPMQDSEYLELISNAK
ncbi:MAG: polysaccharide deacetylase family protein [Clostridia bacterium]|nr:polysaccharide deacetylase family protein [Clostridia bacterium]